MNRSALSRLGRIAATFVTLALVASTTACVDDVGVIDRTKADKVDKTLLEGVWIFSQTTVDAPYTTAASFTGHLNFGGAAKVIFDVQEDWLIAYPVVETVDGSEKGHKSRKIRKYWDADHRDEFMEIYAAQPLGMWKITKHFDVIRDYNTYNGAQTNELVENSSDRPWYQRDFMRVAWHSNTIAPFFFDLAGNNESESYWVGEGHEGSPDYITMDKERGYFDYVVRTNVESYGSHYCSIYGMSPYDCAGAEVKVRHSFRRLDPRRDYEPLRYHNNEHQDKFGYFLTDRPHYDEDWGSSYEGKVFWANRHNLWMTSYDFAKPLDSDGEELDIVCFEDLDCDQAAGQRCQKTTSWFEDGYCATPMPKPYAERGLRPVIYHLNADWYSEYFDAAYLSADGWSDTYKETVSWMLFYEENGVGNVRACDTHADCGTDHLVLDIDVPVTYGAMPCHSDEDCGDFACGGDGYCARARTCSPDIACALGQSCALQDLASQPLGEPTTTCGAHVTEVLGSCEGPGLACQTNVDCVPMTSGCDDCDSSCVGAASGTAEVLGSCDDAGAADCTVDGDCAGAACLGYAAGVPDTDGTCVGSCQGADNQCFPGATCDAYIAAYDADVECAAAEICTETFAQASNHCATSCTNHKDCDRDAGEHCLNLAGGSGRGYCTVICEETSDCVLGDGEHCSKEAGAATGTCRVAVCNDPASGAPVAEEFGTALRGSSLIYHLDGYVLTHDNFPDHLISDSNDDKVEGDGLLDEVPGTCDNATAGICTKDDDCPGVACLGYIPAEAWVRFIHASPTDGALGATVNGIDIAGGEYDGARDYDPADNDPDDGEMGPFMAKVPRGTGVTFAVTAGGATITETLGDVIAGNHYLVIYNGKDILIRGVGFDDSRRGIRFIHAASGEGKLDFAVAGVRLNEAVGYRQATEYQQIAGSTQRVTLTRAGTRGDVNCYVSGGIGRCVGWGQDLDEDDLSRRQDIKDGLPELFVLCRNVFDETSATDQEEMDKGMGSWTDARYTVLGENSGEFYNPCADPELVSDATAPKKVGDIRYSTFNWVNEMMRAGPLGYGPSIADPDTGEILAGFANMYGGAVHTYSQWASDLIGLVNGDIDMEDVATGDWVRQSLAGMNKADQAETGTQFGGLSNATPATEGHPLLSLEADELHERHRLTHDAGLKTLMGAPRKPSTEADFPELTEFMRNPDLWKERVETELPAIDIDFYHNRLGKLKGTHIEEMLLNNEIMAFADSVDVTGDMSAEEIRDELSPVNWASKYAMKQEQARNDFFMKNNMYMGEFVDDSLWGLAKELKYSIGIVACDSGEDCPDSPGGCAIANEGDDQSYCHYTYDDIRLEAGRRIVKGVLEHEIGHTVGLRHNFSGSTDVFNFFDEYYDIREKELILCQDDDWCDDSTGQVCGYTDCASDDECMPGMPCVDNQCAAPSSNDLNDLVPTGVCSEQIPDTTCQTSEDCPSDTALCVVGKCYQPREQLSPRDWLTENEKRDKRTEYQYTTVMDYGGRFNSDFMGLGKYDYAAIKFGYGQLVDTYADDSKLRGRVEKLALNAGGAATQYSYILNTRWWPSRGTGFWHPFRYLSDYIGVEENKNRVPRPYEQVKYQRQMVRNDVREHYDYDAIEVPYAFCSDEYRGNMGCYYFDLGIDAGEMASHAMDQLSEYYIFDAFKRERLYFGRYGSARGYFGRIWDRYLRVLGDVGMYYGFYDTLLFRYSWYSWWKDFPLGGRTLERAAFKTFGYLQDVITSPAPGSFAYDEEKDAYVNKSFEAGAEDSELDIPLGVGRYPYTQFGQQNGYLFYEHPMWFGSFWEKYGALLTLTDSTAYFMDSSVGEQLNIGVGTSVGFNTVFADEMNLFLGSMIAGDLQYYAGRVVQNQYAPFSVATKQDLGVQVEPSLNTFTLKLLAAVYGLAYLPAGFDPRFIDSTAVYLEGEASLYTHANEPGVTTHRFEDPIGGKVYIAFGNNYGEFDSVKVSAGATLVETASDLAEKWSDATGAERARYEQELHSTVEVLDLLRSLNHIYGSSTLGL
jgi:hypothetical protein